jgi:hypothetical protein
MVTLLAPLGLPVVTTAERDALTPSDGWLVWNSDDLEVQAYRDGEWGIVNMEPGIAEVVGALAVDLAKIRAALRYLGVDSRLFDPIEE